MSEEATIEDEPEVEQSTHSSRPETNTGLLKWSYIFEIVTKQWAAFLLVSIAIAVFLYMSRQRRSNTKGFSSAVRGDHIQGGSKGTSRSTSYKRE